LGKRRSKKGIVHSGIDVKTWLLGLPTVEQARPARCPHCGRVGHGLGQVVGLVGHGVRERQLRGPIEPGGSSATLVLLVRRYRCRWCAHTVTVLPRGVVALRHYGGYAIASAFWSYGVKGDRLEQTRGMVAGGVTFEAGWPSLRRWAQAAGRGELFGQVRRWPLSWTVRQQAERIATTLLALVAGHERDPHSRLRQAAELAA
jgi:hypothetical protein